jgi:hypothetical protein
LTLSTRTFPRVLNPIRPSVTSTSSRPSCRWSFLFRKRFLC